MGVNEFEGVVLDIRVTIKTLRIGGIGYNCVGLNPAVNISVVVAGAVVVGAKVLGALAGFLPDRGSNRGQHEAPDYQCCR